MAENLVNAEECSEMMSDKNLSRLLEYLKTVKGWTDSEIVELLEYLSK